VTAPFEIEEQDAPEVDLALRARERSEEPPVVCFPLRIDWELAGGAQKERRAHPEPEEVGEWVRELSDVPSAVLKLAERAREASWDVELRYARGTGVHGSTGAPTSLRHSIAVRAARPIDGAQIRAVYASPVRGAAAWSWVSVWIWSPELPHFGLCSQAELVEWIEGVTGLGAWVAGIRERVRAAEEADEEQKAARKLLKDLIAEEGLEQACSLLGVELEIEEARALVTKRSGKKRESGG
jgi:hypothetical protein